MTNNSIVRSCCSLVFAFSVMMSTGIWFSPAIAADHVVKMKDEGAAGALVFEPALLNIAVGDTVTFEPESAIHNTQSMMAMIPEGGSEWKSEVGKGVTVTFDKEGVYGYRCLPHYFIGMVGLIVVGDPSSNIEQAKAAKHMGLANQKFTELFGQF